MFGHPTFPRSSSEFLSDSLPSPEDIITSPLNFPLRSLTQLTVAESSDSVSDAFHSGSGSGSYNSPSFCTRTGKPSLMQRSVSSHSLQFQKNGLHSHFASSLNEFIDSDSGPVRRVFSTGDLDQGQQSHRRSESPLSSESNAIIEGMSRACRYSPEEKKERIERYRSKRNLRNFNKKIKYACRKTLADSRPRIRGRFARNEEIEKNPQVEWSNVGGEEEEEDEENWIHFLDSLSANLINP
ncbi:zinc finger protein CONSTANS-LIKE 2-like [Durio zibethinus]|uniref:Zinc finger protein CONSTANS-LIKE 2-like n=1 Tax=Durio zibethinus TaxID=66656 RepID=A0A6P5XSR5_DURZI|nr:zinc finger protein CONSTANS-LIKE 2-like [Durio zibethinus]